MSEALVATEPLVTPNTPLASAGAPVAPGAPSPAAVAGASALAAVAGKYLTFYLGSEEYGLPILQVQEIVGLLPVTPVPQTPAHVLGVVNLRGQVIPVVDLRARFGLPAVASTPQTCIVFVEAGGQRVGTVVDRVNEVLAIGAADVEPPPALGSSVDTSYLRGLAKSSGHVRLLLDVDRVLGRATLA
jgi:purine-binding chemotaxis protein CheW